MRSLLPSGHRLSLTPSPSLLSRRYSITIEATDKSELKLETIIGKVKAAVQVDHHGRSGDGGDEADVFSLESFLQALDEELGNSKSYFGEDDSKAKALDFEATIKKIDKGKFNWGLFEVQH